MTMPDLVAAGPPFGASAGARAALERWRLALAEAGIAGVDAPAEARLAAAAGGDATILAAALRQCGGRPRMLEELEAVAGDVRRDRLTAQVRAMEPVRRLALCVRALLGPVPARLVELVAGARVTDADLDEFDLDDPVVADAVLSTVDSERRAELRCSAVHAAHDDGFPAGTVGRLLAATAPGWPDWAGPALRTAAGEARDGHRWAEAALLFERALREPAVPAVRLATIVALGEVQLGRAPHAADRRFAEVLRTGATPGDGGGGESCGSDAGPWRALAADRLLVRGDDAFARREIAAAYRRARESDRAPLAALYWTAADRLQPTAGPDDAGVPAPEELPPDAAALGVLAWRTALAGRDLAGARRRAFAALDAPFGDDTPAGPRLAAVRALILAEDLPAAEARLEPLLARLRRAGAAAAPALLLRAELHLRDGYMDEAERDLGEARMRLPDDAWHPAALPRVRSLQVMLHLATGRSQQAAAVLRAPLVPGAAAGTAWTELLYARAAAEAAAGRPGAALSLLRECGRRCVAAGHDNPVLLPWRSLAALCAHATDRPAEAALLLEPERAATQRWGTPRAVATTLLRAALVGGGPEAVTRTGPAMALLRELQGDRGHLEAWLTFGIVAAIGDRSAAAAAATWMTGAAATRRPSRPAVPTPSAPRPEVRVTRANLFEVLGAAYSAEPPAVAAERRIAVGELSRAQRRVAELAAGGLPNAAIAQALSLNKRTVEFHLSNIYRKLGIAGRAELAGVLGGAGPPTWSP
ncbi:helix-turn-helix transcriptional regulator [Dactylosporangium matsuzakiense]|uniref:helix-turn-helix transcriptional regulator n=1 Tax=Dactylosporangium matsuzakiense TaxID=53360 RepID=UPI0021C44699|nr:helix-turn-helix transcriptional regulator [Dactylosporangium matsuzakiense]UWZ41198.1 helix-turn-helix transcriptional regulator [Dactylosporangium matsuzakiense]